MLPFNDDVEASLGNDTLNLRKCRLGKLL